MCGVRYNEGNSTYGDVWLEEIVLILNHLLVNNSTLYEKIAVGVFRLGCFLTGLFLFIILWLFAESPALGSIVLIGFVAAGIVVVVMDSQRRAREISEKEDNLQTLKEELHQLTFSQEFIDPNLNSQMLLDERHKKIIFLYPNQPSPFIYDFRDIYESEVLIDGNMVTNTTRSSQLAGAFIGGVLAGGPGMVVGGLSGETTTNKTVNRVDLRVVVNDTNQPNHVINFLMAPINEANHEPIPIRTGSYKYEEAIKEVDHWHSLLSIIINNETTEKKMLQNHTHSAHYSVADEINKLLQLREKGVITTEEFERLKRNLLVGKNNGL